MRYQRCKYWDAGWCYNDELKGDKKAMACCGSDRCKAFTVEKLPESGRIDNIGQNGNDGEVYLVERLAKAIAGIDANQVLKGGKKRWELFIPNAMRVLDCLREAEQEQSSKGIEDEQ